MNDKPRVHWAEDVREEIVAALLTAQNSLTGYFNLSNSPYVAQHHACAQQALETVRRRSAQVGCWNNRESLRGGGEGGDGVER